MNNLKNIIQFLRGNIVLCISLVAAIITCFIVPPDREYVNYFDGKTLTCLFCTLAVVCALKNIGFFYIIARKIVNIFGNLRSQVIALVYITFIGSMLIANDMALITFLPLGYYVLISTNNEKYMAFTFIMQNIAANLGGMLTPFGNPQNLYMYSFYNIPTIEFVKIMLLPFVISVMLITLCCFIFVKNTISVLYEEKDVKLNINKTIYYLLLFFLSIIIVFDLIPYIIGLIVIFIGIIAIDRKAIKSVDYSLLLTFCAFFVFSGNMARIPAVDNTVGNLVRTSPLLIGVASCQVISNVPSAVLLSKFTGDYARLLVAVNIGGTGTLIASLASLITYREFGKCMPEYMNGYLKKFTIFNFCFVIILTIIMYFYMK